MENEIPQGMTSEIVSEEELLSKGKVKPKTEEKGLMDFIRSFKITVSRKKTEKVI